MLKHAILKLKLFQQQSLCDGDSTTMYYYHYSTCSHESVLFYRSLLFEFEFNMISFLIKLCNYIHISRTTELF